MKEAVTTSRGSRSRRTIATLTWAGLVVAAGLLWHGRVHGTMRSVTTEPIALLLSAYTAFSSIFAWMLFSPNRRAAAESPALFLAGGITLLPPCIISYCLMPPDSPLRSWVTVGVFLLTVAAVVSPVPDEFFAVPRDRSTYLRPISDAMFTSLDVLDLRAGFEHLQTIETRQPSRLTPYSPETVEWPTRSGDPWENPFLGTGIEPIRPAVRRSGQRTDSQLRSQTAAAADNLPAAHQEAAREATGPRYSDAVRDAAQSAASTALRRAAQSTTAAPAAVTPSTSSARRPGSELPASHHALGVQRPAAAFGFRPPTAETPQPQPSAVPPTARLQPAPVRGPAPAARPASPTTTAPLSMPVIPAVPAVPPPLPSTPPPLPTASADAATPVAYAYVPPGSRAPAVAPSPAAPAQSPFEDFVSQRTRDDLADSSTIADDSSIDHRTGLDDRTAAAEDNGLKAERIRDEYGGEMVEGTVRVVFETGQKRANLHIPFTPPLPGIPEVECESVGDDVLRLKVPVRQPYGIRIEARRSDASGPLETEIGFAAVYSPQRR